MSSNIVQESVRITTHSGAEGGGVVECEYNDERDRRKKAVKSAALLGGLAILSIALPIAHFFLVPGFLIAAIWSYLFFSKQVGSFKESRVICPSCQKDTVVPGGPLKFPTQQVCDSCRTLITIDLANEKAG